MINKENYPEYILLFMEGKLSASHMDEFLLFMEKNPQIKEEMEGLEEIRLQPMSEPFKDKGKLLKNLNTQLQSDEELYVSALENDLNEEEKLKFLQWVEEDNRRKKQFLLYRQTKLSYNSREIFKHKKNLYKKTNRHRTYYYSLAALLLAILMIPLLWQSPINFESSLNKNTQKRTIITDKTSKEKITKNGASYKLSEQKVIPAENKRPIHYKSDHNKIYTVSADTAKSKQIAFEYLPPLKTISISAQIQASPSPEATSVENPITELNTEEKQQHKKEYISPGQWLLAEIKKTSEKNTKTTRNMQEQEQNNNRIHASDIAGLLLGGINRITGSQLQFIFERDPGGSITAMGIKGEERGFIMEK